MVGTRINFSCMWIQYCGKILVFIGYDKTGTWQEIRFIYIHVYPQKRNVSLVWIITFPFFWGGLINFTVRQHKPQESNSWLKVKFVRMGSDHVTAWRPEFLASMVDRKSRIWTGEAHSPPNLSHVPPRHLQGTAAARNNFMWPEHMLALIYFH